MGIPGVRVLTVAVALAGLAYLLYYPSLSLKGVSLSHISMSGSVPAAVEGARRLVGVAWMHLKPGGIYHPREFLETYHGHYYVEVVLLVIIGRYMLEGSRRVGGGKESGPLTAEEVEALCAEWVPEGLCGGVDGFQRRWMDWGLVVLGRVGAGRLDVGVGDGVVVRGALDLVTTDWFEVSSSEQARLAGQKTLDVIGVGSCGPRGFYGTVDVHLELEDILAKFLRTEEAILYSYDSATVPSIIPAFANAKDTLVIDDGCAYAVRLGCQLSRATVFTFRHNDMEDLERVLKKVVEDDRRKRKPLNRRFVIVEGLYHHTGDIADLKSIVKIKNRYRFRLLVDESLSIGTLGATGRGACEHCGVAPEDVEILAGSLGHGVGSIGGFCAGAREMVDHQRLSGLGYCFSASLPPYLASTSCAVIREWMDDTVRLRGLQKKLWANGAAFREAFGKAMGPNGMYEVLGDMASPLLHVRFRVAATDDDEVTEQNLKLQMAVERALEKDKVLFTVSKYSKLDASYRPRPSIKVALKSSLSEADVRVAAKSLAQSLVSV